VTALGVTGSSVDTGDSRGTPLGHLLTELELEQVAPLISRARGVHLSGRRNLFGGQVLAQAMLAASTTFAEPAVPSSAHIEFLSEGKFGEPVDYHVSRLRDGRRFAVRAIAAVQGARTIAHLSASFTRQDSGMEFGARPVAAPTPPPAQRSPGAESRSWIHGFTAAYNTDAGPEPVRDSVVWARANGNWPSSDRTVSAALLAYLSDLRSGVPVYTEDGVSYAMWDNSRPVLIASLNHSLWIHRTPVDDPGWITVRTALMAAGPGRILSTGTLHDAGGLHLASFAQELVMREFG